MTNIISIPSRIMLLACGFGVCFFIVFFYLWFLEMAMGFYGIDIIPDMHNLFWGCAIIVSGIGAASIVLSASLWFFMEEYKSLYIKKEKEVLKEVSTRNIEITETDNVEKNSTEDSEKLKANKD